MIDLGYPLENVLFFRRYSQHLCYH